MITDAQRRSLKAANLKVERYDKKLQEQSKLRSEMKALEADLTQVEADLERLSTEIAEDIKRVREEQSGGKNTHAA